MTAAAMELVGEVTSPPAMIRRVTSACGLSAAGGLDGGRALDHVLHVRVLEPLGGCTTTCPDMPRMPRSSML